MGAVVIHETGGTEVLPWSEVRHAHELIESGHTRGKLVLAVAG